MESQNMLAPFEGKQIRKILHDEEWYFSVVDIIEVLTDSPIPRNYWNLLKKREPQLHTICMQLKLESKDGKKYNTDCANTEGVLRIAMSVPSPKAEPLKLWLAQVGKEKIEETENPELGFERLTELYRAKGHTEEWIKNRLQSITTRKQLTDEWQKRGVKDGQEYSILTATIAKGTFGVTPKEHKDIKGLTKPSENLRDHMTPLELIFTALGEELTRMQTVRADAQGFLENHDAATEGGRVAGVARERVEKEQNINVVSSDNYLNLKSGEQNTLFSKTEE
jgi:prophage antirepressor-like protein